MALVDELGDKLAADVMRAMLELNNDRLYIDVGKVLGTSSLSLQETFLTSIRLRLAEQRGRVFFEEAVRAVKAGVAPPKAPSAPEASGGH